MSDPNDDFATFIGPDKRRPPKIGWRAGVVLGIAVFVVTGMALLLPRDSPALDLSVFGFASDVVPATVETVESGPCSYAADLTCNNVDFGFEWDDVQEVYRQEFSDDTGQPSLEQGDSVYLNVNVVDGAVSFQYADRDRRLVLIGVALAFSAAVVGLARMRGVYALVGLVSSILVLLLFIIPAIVAGQDAVLVALVGGGAIALISLYVTHGTNPLTHVAAIGAFGALAITTALSWLVVEAAQFTGLADEHSFYLIAIPGFDLSGLLLAGIVLGTIGALDDVTVTQASAVWEVANANPKLGPSQLFESGLRVGRDHIASTVNTLVLAYAGAALPLLILFSLSDLGLGFIASSEVVAVEIVRTLVGSIGLVAAVPLTTWLASRALLLSDQKPA